jgi:magnesium-transporting ATPase (P-type)
MLKYLLSSDIDVSALIEQKKDRMIIEIPFDSKRKRQTTIVR